LLACIAGSLIDYIAGCMGIGAGTFNEFKVPPTVIEGRVVKFKISKHDFTQILTNIQICAMRNVYFNFGFTFNTQGNKNSNDAKKRLRGRSINLKIEK
jgi:hypothetical protein